MDEGEDEGGVLERAGAALRIVGMKADKVRKDFDFWIHTSIWGMGWDVLNCILSLVSVFTYIVQTYYPEYVLEANPSARPMVEQLDRMELWMTFFFLFDYVLYLYAADQRVKHMCQFLQVIDFVTIVPSLLTFIMKSANPNGGKHLRESLEKASQLNFLRFVRVLKLLRILRLLRAMNSRKADTAAGEVFKQILTMVLTGLSLVFCFAGLFQIVETSPEFGRPLAELLEIWDQETFQFHDSLYFTIITVHTHTHTHTHTRTHTHTGRY
jgi:hypothetical protein